MENFKNNCQRTDCRWKMACENGEQGGEGCGKLGYSPAGAPVSLPIEIGTGIRLQGDLGTYTVISASVSNWGIEYSALSFDGGIKKTVSFSHRDVGGINIVYGGLGNE